MGLPRKCTVSTDREDAHEDTYRCSFALDQHLLASRNRRGAFGRTTDTGRVSDDPKLIRGMDEIWLKNGGLGWRNEAGEVITMHGFRSSFGDWAAETTLCPNCTQHCMHCKIVPFSIVIDGLIMNGTRRAFERLAMAGTGEALRLDPSKFEISCYGLSSTLKPTPYRLMHLLVQNSGHVVSRKAIYKEIWGYDFDPGTKLIEVQVHYLRGVLSRLMSVFEIKTYRGKGICLQALDQYSFPN